jgi:hypothetical protein
MGMAMGGGRGGGVGGMDKRAAQSRASRRGSEAVAEGAGTQRSRVDRQEWRKRGGVRHGEVRRGVARHGVVWRGQAWRGGALAGGGSLHECREVKEDEDGDHDSRRVGGQGGTHTLGAHLPAGRA